MARAATIILSFTAMDTADARAINYITTATFIPATQVRCPRSPTLGGTNSLGLDSTVTVAMAVAIGGGGDRWPIEPGGCE